MKQWFALVSLFFATLASAGSQTITVMPGQTQLVIKLAGNPTTGYVWAAKDYDQATFEITGNGYLPEKTDRVGAGGTYQFIFKILQPVQGQQKIVLELKRPWEKKAVMTKTYLVTQIKADITEG